MPGSNCPGVGRPAACLLGLGRARLIFKFSNCSKSADGLCGWPSNIHHVERPGPSVQDQQSYPEGRSSLLLTMTMNVPRKSCSWCSTWNSRWRHRPLTPEPASGSPLACGRVNVLAYAVMETASVLDRPLPVRHTVTRRGPQAGGPFVRAAVPPRVARHLSTRLRDLEAVGLHGACTIPEAMAYARVSRRTIYHWITNRWVDVIYNPSGHMRVVIASLQRGVEPAAASTGVSS